MKKFIWFDLGYTLIYLERERPYLEFLKTHNIERSLEAIEAAFHLADKYFMRKSNGFFNEPASVYMDDYLKKLNGYMDITKDISYNDMQKVYQSQGLKVNWQVFDFTVHTLNKLRQNKIGVGLISNWDHTARNVLNRLNLMTYFDEIVISSEVGISKPHIEIFNNALNKTGLNPSDCLYIGDNYYDDMIGCQKVGMEGRLINRLDNLGIEELPMSSYRTIREAVKEYL